MRIYTITFCNTTNVGAALQEMALQNYLKEVGNEVKVVKYIPPIMKNAQTMFSGNLIKTIALFPFNLFRRYKYWEFARVFITYTPKCNCSMDISFLQQPDLYIAGSDQIWNPEMLKWDDGFFLNFTTKAAKASYAASMGVDKLDKHTIEKVASFINEYKMISVREYNLKQELEKKKNRKISLVLDPVFLLEKEYYTKIAIIPKFKDYILIYEAEINDNLARIAKTIAIKKNLKIIQINRLNNRYRVDCVVPVVSPTEFLGLIENASYVVTNSFHAVAFSIIFEKNFCTVKLKKRSVRIESLLKLCKLESRIMDADNVNCITDTINYSQINILLEKAKDDSKKYLKQLLARV